MKQFLQNGRESISNLDFPTNYLESTKLEKNTYKTRKDSNSTTHIPYCQEGTGDTLSRGHQMQTSIGRSEE